MQVVTCMILADESNVLTVIFIILMIIDTQLIRITYK